jgi:hypothetical protein
MLPNGTPLMMYTSVQEEADKAGQWTALGDKALMSFCRQGETPVIRRDQPGGPCLDAGFRDPFLFPQNGMLYAAVAGLYAQNGEERAGIHLYKAQGEGFGTWLYLGVLIGSPVAQTPYYECPSCSRGRPVGARVLALWAAAVCDRPAGRGNCRFEPLYEGRLDETNKAYATVNLNGLNGKAYLMSGSRDGTASNTRACSGADACPSPGKYPLPKRRFPRPGQAGAELAGTPVTACDGMAIRDTGFCLSADRVPAGFRLKSPRRRKRSLWRNGTGRPSYQRRTL